MTPAPIASESDIYRKLKWLMFFRLLFTTLLIGSTIIMQLRESPSLVARPLLALYGLTAAIFILSICYAILLNRIRHTGLFAYLQIGVDTLVVTLIIFLTGSFSSLFGFLYLVVIVYASMLLYMRGAMIMAALCSIQYGIMIDLEYYTILKPLSVDSTLTALGYDWSHVLYNILMIMAACFAVGFLSGFLSEQTRKTRKKLEAMEDHVKRVEKMAAIGEMAAGLAHEIKNPLASLAGSIQLLQEEIRYDREHDKLMQIVLREAARLSTLVNNFLLFARPPLGKREAIRLDHAVLETVELFEKDSTCSDRIRLEKDLAAGIWIEMDPLHLRQVLLNLLLNAAEAIAEEGRISIATFAIRDGQAAIRIRDNGCGMSREIRKSIFDPFFTTKPSGTGLGLSIVHSILDSYGSRLFVDSENGRGATFTLSLKRIAAPAGSS